MDLLYLSLPEKINMEKVEKIYEGNTLVSIIFRGNIKYDDPTFVTPAEYPIQVGIHNTLHKKVSSKHRNGFINLSGKIRTHEVVFVQSGAVRVNYFSKKGVLLTSKKLKGGDGVLIMNVDHQIIMSKKTRVIEIKQGPYAKKI